MPAHQRRDPVDGVGLEPQPGRDLAGDRLARDAVLGQSTLPDVVQQGGDHEDVRAGDVADQARRLDAGLDDVAVDGEPVDRRRVREQPDPLPLRQQLVEGTGVLQRLPDRQQPATRGEQPHEQLAGAVGPRHGERCAVAHEPLGRDGREHRVALGGLDRGAEQEQRILLRAGPRVEHDLAAGERESLGDAHEVRGARPSAGRGLREQRVGATPGQA